MVCFIFYVNGLHDSGTHIYEFGVYTKSIWCLCHHLARWLNEIVQTYSSFSLVGIYVSITVVCRNPSPKELRHRLYRSRATEQIILLQLAVSVNQKDWQISSEKNKHTIQRERHFWWYLLSLFWFKTKVTSDWPHSVCKIFFYLVQ